MTNSQEIFSIALGLESPWQISSVNFESTPKSQGQEKESIFFCDPCCLVH